MFNKVKSLLARPALAHDHTPLLTSGPDIAALQLGAEVRFSEAAPAPLKENNFRVIGLYSYVFDDTVIESFRLKGADGAFFQLMVAEDEQGYYLALSRVIDANELHRLMQKNGVIQSERDGLELPETLKDSEWFASQYQTSISDMYGTLYLGRVPADGALRHHGRRLRYTLYSSAEEGAAIEVEQYSDGTFQVMASLYRGVEAIEEIVAPAQPASIEAAQEVPEYTPHLRPVPTLADDALSLAEWLDEPHAVTVGLSVPAAIGVMHDAFYSGQRLNDVLREQLGLDVIGKEEVGLTLHLNEADYKQLAMRYQLKASNKEAIHKRLRDEITQRYAGVKIHG